MYLLAALQRLRLETVAKYVAFLYGSLFFPLCSSCGVKSCLLCLSPSFCSLFLFLHKSKFIIAWTSFCFKLPPFSFSLMQRMVLLMRRSVCVSFLMDELGVLWVASRWSQVMEGLKNRKENSGRR